MKKARLISVVAVPLGLPPSFTFPVSVLCSYVLCDCLPLVHFSFFPPFFCSPSLISAALLLVGEAACCQAEYISLCAISYDVHNCYFMQSSSAWSHWHCAFVHVCGSAAYCMSFYVPLCACSYLEVKDGGSRKSGVLIERQRCTVIIMKALQEKLNWRRREIERAL